MMRRIVSSRLFQFIALMVILCGVAWLATANSRINQTLRNYAFDTFNRLDERPASDQVIIVDIDENSLRQIGQWPWPRDIIAQMVLNLKDMGAKAIAFDMVFAEPDRMSPKLFAKSLLSKNLIDRETLIKLSKLPNNDEIISQAFKTTNNVVTGFTVAKSDETIRLPFSVKQLDIKSYDALELEKHTTGIQIRGAATNIPIIGQNAAGNGSFVAIPDEDGIIRQQLAFTIFRNSKLQGFIIYPSLGLEALRVAFTPEEQINYTSKIETGSNNIIKTNNSNWQIPVQNDARMYLKFRNIERQKDYVSAKDVIWKNDSVGNKIQNKIVLIGSSAEGLRDIRNTAIEAFVPGVEVHFNFIEQVLQGIYLSRENNTAITIERALIFICGGFIILASVYFGPVILTFLSSTFIGGIFGGTFYLYKFHGLLLDPINPSLAIFAIFVIATLVNYLRSELSKREIREAFGLYISPDFMEELTDNPDKLSLGGEIRDLTVMFTDIRNFTTISEALTPEELILTMNDFLTPMSDVVMKRRGTIDKYMGDAMMAFWNAPLDDENHARNAVLAALDMKAALEPVNTMLKERADRHGTEPLKLSAGIGINSGPCAVGNMGSKQRFAYSALGDAVNLASRLEGQTKAYGLDLLIGEETVSQVRDFATVDIDMIQVKGKTKPVRIYTVLGDADMATQEKYKLFIQDHGQFIEAYRKGDFKTALILIKACINHAMAEPLEVYYAMMSERIKTMQKKTPPQWDGVFIATSK